MLDTLQANQPAVRVGYATDATYYGRLGRGHAMGAPDSRTTHSSFVMTLSADYI